MQILIVEIDDMKHIVISFLFGKSKNITSWSFKFEKPYSHKIFGFDLLITRIFPFFRSMLLTFFIFLKH